MYFMHSYASGLCHTENEPSGIDLVALFDMITTRNKQMLSGNLFKK